MVKFALWICWCWKESWACCGLRRGLVHLVRLRDCQCWELRSFRSRRYLLEDDKGTEVGAVSSSGLLKSAVGAGILAFPGSKLYERLEKL